jgi:DNA-directed RNA polymerase subunit N (RpoN/RPB10)
MWRKFKVPVEPREMIPPVRCYNCGKVLADLYRTYEGRLKDMKSQKVYFDGKAIPETPEKKVMDELGIHRLCCRTIFLTQITLIDKI